MQPDEVDNLPGGLEHVSDRQPGILRRRAGSGFSYVGANGAKVADAKTLYRIRGLAIRPAWTDVWICPSANGHLQASGRDQRDRKQYRYHPDWISLRSEDKFARLAEFARALPTIRERVKSDLSTRRITLDRVLASVVWLLDRTVIRVGNDTYARENGSFGLTTLRSRHVDVNGSVIHLKFQGKSGREWQLKLSDRRIAATVKSLDELPGQQLFQYVDETGARRRVHSHDVNDYLRAASGLDLTSKHFRTWSATQHAIIQLAQVPRPAAVAERRRALNEVLDRIARRLRNTRTVCRACYVHPQAIKQWEQGDLGELWLKLRQRYRRPIKGLDCEETLVLHWLEDHAT